jgi:methylated-DNA-protein-cysteine methyltransferase-like protein
MMNTFSQRVLKLALSIPSGKITTYGRIARAAGGGTQAARSITSILGKAYDRGEKNIPFHRIVFANGRVWLTAAHEISRKKLYKKEGIEIDAKGNIKDFWQKVLDFK